MQIQRVDPTIDVEENYVPMPWAKIEENQVNLVAKVNKSLTVQDFSTKSLRAWKIYFTTIFDCNSVTSRIGRLAIVYNCCPNCQRIDYSQWIWV